MKQKRLPTRDVRENRSEREEKFGQALETLPGKTERDRNSRTSEVHIPQPKTMPRSVPTPATRAEALRAATAVSFRLNAPEAAQVSVAGTFNDWNPGATPLSKGRDGEWQVEQLLEPGEYEYRFVVDGIWKEDPAAKRGVSNPFGGQNSILSV